LLESKPNFLYFNDPEKYNKACIIHIEEAKLRYDKMGYMDMKALLKAGILQVKRDKDGKIQPWQYDITKLEDNSIILSQG